MDTIKAQGKMSNYLNDKNRTLKASREDLSIVESMPCIEIWFLLHYPYNDRYYPSYDSLKKAIRKAIPGYKKDKQWAGIIYSKLKDKIKLASKNAALTMKKKESCELDCSYTNMHELISKLDELYAQHSRESLHKE